jgi:antitoxin VapB
MSLNIKNPETHRLAAELARRTGTSMTEAVTEALRDKLERLTSPEEIERRVAKVTAIANEMRARMGDNVVSNADIDALYDPVTGLPK